MKVETANLEVTVFKFDYPSNIELWITFDTAERGKQSNKYPYELQVVEYDCYEGGSSFTYKGAYESAEAAVAQGFLEVNQIVKDRCSIGDGLLAESRW